MSALYQLLSSKYHPPAIPEQTFAGKTILLTGGTSGLGLEAAKKIVALEAWTVIITARDRAKGELAKEEIEFVCQERASDDLDIQVWPLDMSSFESVKSFADRVNKELPRLDVAILNAGQVNPSWKTASAADGSWEMTLMVNTLATVFLGLLLLPKLLATAESKAADPTDPPRLNFISSSLASHQKPEQYEKFQGCQTVLEKASEKKAFEGGRTQYGMSKLFLEYGLRHISRLPSVAKDSGETKVIVNSTCPGFCRSGLGESTQRGLFISLLIWLFKLIFGRSTEEGSRSYVSGVQVGSDGHGKIWTNDQYADPGPMIAGEQGKALGDEVWREMVEIFEKQSPRIRDLLSSS